MLPFLEAHPLGLQDDAACVVIAGSAESSPSQVDAVHDGDGQPAHCVVCHLMRAMSGAVSTDVTTVAAPFVASAPDRLPEHLTLATAFSAPTSRGPPASL